MPGKVMEAVGDLHQRFLRVIGRKPWAHIAKEIGVSRIVVMNFVNGVRINMESVDKIEQWCDREEHRHAREAGHGDGRG